MTVYSPEVIQGLIQPKAEQLRTQFYTQAGSIRKGLQEKFQDPRVSMVTPADLAATAASVFTGLYLFDEIDGKAHASTTVARIRAALQSGGKTLPPNAEELYLDLFGSDDDFYGMGTLADYFTQLRDENDPVTIEEIGRMTGKYFMIRPDVIPYPNYDISVTSPEVSLTTAAEGKKIALPGIPARVMEVNPSIGTLSTLLGAATRARTILAATEPFRAAVFQEASQILGISATSLSVWDSPANRVATDMRNGLVRDIDLMVVTVTSQMQDADLQAIVQTAKDQSLSPSTASLIVRTPPRRSQEVYSVVSGMMGEARAFDIPPADEKRLSTFHFTR